MNPHIKYESGMYDYDGQYGYSNFTYVVKEYVLHGIESENESRVINMSPVTIENVEVEKDSD